MQKAGLLLGLCARTWKSVRMASSAVARRNPLENKVALVTASTDGIGFAIARRLAQDGAHVVVSSRKQQNVDRAVATLHGEGLSVTGTVCHVGKGEDRERLVATILDINVKATALMTKAVVPEMEKRGGGSVVIVASVGAYRPFPGLGPYNVCKTALLGLTKNLALELAQRNIRVNCLAPGLIKTNFSRMPRVQTRPPHDPFLRCTVRLRNSDTTQAISYLLKWLWDDQARLESLKATMQIKRIGKPEDCAGIVSFLCSEDASYITGETVVVAGGMPSRL
ncbi:dehydrogenase/reductase SDR family member 4 isoform X3 [Balaenoptera acutorostrata]|uniref:Dehydrogenase/reductase SDR family member 4 isoform X3 n=1 Tax=Balaenoptera acutorostrata TaxID=9767 RepID=A0A383ZZW8_BALAC|nr:dehydrogenase/reductase SDR family member 4 isoform X3 [Balaenoptera acutorostrata]